MNKANCALTALKYTLFAITAVVLILLWNIMFIVQGGIGLEVNLFLLPVTLLPILLYSTFACWLILKMFDYKEKVPQKRKLSFAIGTISIVLSLSFQHFVLSKKTAPFVFKNEMFSHLNPIKVTDSVPQRVALSFFEFIRLTPVGTTGTDSTSYIANIFSEALLNFKLKKLVTNSNLQQTCKNYIEQHGGYNSCIIDIQKEIYSQYTFSSTGNTLLVAVGAVGIFETKERMKKQDKVEAINNNLKIANDIIELSMLSAQKSKEIVSNKDRIIYFSMGHKLTPTALITLIEHQVNYKFIRTFVERIEEMVSSARNKYSSSEYDEQKTEQERARFEELSTQFIAFQEEGFTVEELKKKEEEIEIKLENKVNELEDESLLFQVASFFDLSILDLITTMTSKS